MSSPWKLSLCRLQSTSFFFSNNFSNRFASVYFILSSLCKYSMVFAFCLNFLSKHHLCPYVNDYFNHSTGNLGWLFAISHCFWLSTKEKKKNVNPLNLPEASLVKCVHVHQWEERDVFFSYSINRCDSSFSFDRAFVWRYCLICVREFVFNNSFFSSNVLIT